MIPHSLRFAAAVKTSHQMAVRARVVTPGQAGTDPDGTEVPVLDGDVRQAATEQIRASLDLTTQWQWPRRATDLFAPYGNEIYVERGIAYADGTSELLGLGYFRIQTVEQQQAPRDAIRVTAPDRMAGIVDATLLRPRQYGKTTTYGTVLSELVGDVYPNVVIEWDDASDSQQIGRKVVTEQDRFTFLDDLVTGLGKVWFFDHVGVLQIASPPDPTDPVDVILAGDGGVLVSASRQITREGIFNAVTATGEGADSQSPPVVTAYDLSPTSPTYWNGPFGQVPTTISLPSITTTQQAGAAARSYLLKSIGMPYSVDYSAVPNPAHEVLDPIKFRFSPETAPEVHVIDTLTVPLTVDGQFTGTTREQTNVLIGVS